MLVVALLHSSIVLAHGEEPRLEITPERLPPGGTLELRGVGFEFEETVRLALLGAGLEIPLGEIVADTEGSFLQIVTVPAEIREGIYHVRAMTDDHDILSPVLTVQGSPLIYDEGGEPREQAESLLAPLPTNPSVVQTVVPQEKSGVTPPRSGSPVLPLAAAALVLIAVFTLVAWASKRGH